MTTNGNNSAAIMSQQDDDGKQEPQPDHQHHHHRHHHHHQPNRPSPTLYKLDSLAQLSQSVLNTVACLILVSLTTLWTCLQSYLLDPLVKFVCANFQEYQLYQQQQQLNSSESSSSNTTTTETTVKVRIVQEETDPHQVHIEEEEEERPISSLVSNNNKTDHSHFHCDPQFLNTCDPQFLNTCDPQFLNTCDPQFPKSYCDPQFLKSCDPQLSTICGQRSYFFDEQQQVCTTPTTTISDPKIISSTTFFSPSADPPGTCNVEGQRTLNSSAGSKKRLSAVEKFSNQSDQQQRQQYQEEARECEGGLDRLIQLQRIPLNPIQATENYYSSGNNFRRKKMTIEVPAECPPPSALPVLRINSVNIEDPLLDSTQFILSSSGSDGEDGPDTLLHHGGVLYTDDSANESGNNNLIRRDSDTSDVSSNDGSVEDLINGPAPEITSKIIAQVENMFSDDHLAKDGFLLKHVRRRSDGFVSLKLVAGLRKVKQISREFPIILTALKQSDKLEVNDEGTKIRRVDPLTPTLKALPIASQKNKEKEVLSKSPSSSGDDLPCRNAKGTAISFSTGFSIMNATVATEHNKENARTFGGRANGKTSRSNSKDFGPQKEQPFGNNGQHKQQQQLGRSNNNNNANNNGRDIVVRRRGGSLPIAVGSVHPNHQGNGSSHRPSSTYLSPNSSPPSGFLQQRPKSNSYCEGLTTSSTMSPWLQRRKAASTGNVIISSVIRQPRGPDGTRGFAAGPRPLLVQ